MNEEGITSTGQAPLSRRILMYSIMLTIILVSIEILAFVAITLTKYKGIFYDPSLITQSYLEYLDKYDVNLGWPSRKPIKGQAENSAVDGSRPDPVFPVEARPCLSLFGDSFTWAAEVADKDAWASVLSAKLKCRAANFGVSGYGTDQAFVRFRLLPPTGGVVLLNHFSEDIVRNVNQFRNLIYPVSQFQFKPRFVVRNSGVELVPIPEIAASDIQMFLKDPAPYLTTEYFLPDGPSGTQAISFPYSMVVLKAIFRNYRIYAKVLGIPYEADFYLPEHPSHGLEVTYEILSSFAQEAATREQIPIVTLMPTCPDLKYFDATHRFPYDPLEKLIAAQGIRYIDFGRQIARRIKQSPPESLYHSCSGHLNEIGNGILAEITFEYLANDKEIERRLFANAGVILARPVHLLTDQ
jgi:hypothetical protein